MLQTAKFALMLLLLTPGLFSQGLEPSLKRAADRCAREFSDVLLARDADHLQGLAVVPGWNGRKEVGVAVTDALVGVGFRVVPEVSSRSAPGILQLRVGASDEGSHSHLVVETVEEAPWRFTCAYGEAGWVDGDRESLVLVESSLHRDREAAVAWVRRAANRRILSRSGLHLDALTEQEVFDWVAYRLFVGEEVDANQTLYRAFLEVDASAPVLSRLNDSVVRAARREAALPWFRLVGTILFAAIFGLAYLRADLSTRGYLSSRLRLLFGTLFVLGAGMCWRVPL